MKAATLTLMILASTALSGCISTAPSTKESVVSNITFEHDEFRNTSWMYSDTYSNKFENNIKMDLLLVDYKLRALYKGESKVPVFIQLYATNSASGSWRFLNSATGQDGRDLPFSKIDKNTNVVAGDVATVETFAVEIPLDYLRKMSSSDWKIKIYGDKGDGIITIPSVLTSGFLEKIESYYQQD